MTRHRTRPRRASLGAALALLFLGSAGCATAPAAASTSLVAVAPAFELEPGFRVCCVFGYGLRPLVPVVSIGETIGPEDLPGHAYGGGLAEGNGLLHTRRGGFLDLGHLRDYADWTAWLAVRLARRDGEPVPLPLHGARRCEVRLLPGPRPLTDDDLLAIAQRVAFELSVWHEVATWHGWSEVFLYPERVSAFNPEDLYSNLAGAEVGARALRRVLAHGPVDDPLADFERAVDEELAAFVAARWPLPPEGTQAALDAVEGEGRWWSRERTVTEMEQVTRRNLDWHGLEVPPWQVPRELAPAWPLRLPARLHRGEAPTSRYVLTIEPDAQVAAAIRRAGGCAVQTAADLPDALEAIRREVRVLFGPLGDVPSAWEPLLDSPTSRVERGTARDGVIHVRTLVGAPGARRVVQQSALPGRGASDVPLGDRRPPETPSARERPRATAR